MPRIGTRKLYYLLKAEFRERGIKIGRDAFFDHLRSENLLVRPKKSYLKTTHSKHWMRKYPNLLEGRIFTRPEEAFVSDITYLNTRDGTHYLSLVTDAYSRKIMGYHLSDNMATEQVIQALEMAIRNRQTTHPLIHHSDRGLQYCSATYQQLLRSHKITPSMTQCYDCYQNALAERINGILKQEFLIYRCNTKQELKTLIDQAVQTYNQERPHCSLRMKTPNFVHQNTCEEYSTGV